MVELAAVLSEGQEIVEEDVSFHPTHLVNDLLSEELTLEEYNQKIIKYFLAKYDNNVVLTAQKLGVGKSTIYRMLQENKL